MPMSSLSVLFLLCTLMQYKYRELLLRFSLWLNIRRRHRSAHIFIMLRVHGNCETHFHWSSTKNLLLFQLHYWCYEIWSFELFEYYRTETIENIRLRILVAPKIIQNCGIQISGFVLFVCEKSIIYSGIVVCRRFFVHITAFAIETESLLTIHQLPSDLINLLAIFLNSEQWSDRLKTRR